MTLQKWLTLLGCSAAVGLMTTPLHASDPSASRAMPKPLSATTQRLLDQANLAAQQNKWELCRALLLNAWPQNQHPLIAATLGRCEVRLGLHRDAAGHLSYALQHAPQDIPKPKLIHTTELLDEATSKIVTLTIKLDPPDTEVLLNGNSLGSGLLSETVYLDVGTYTLGFRAEGRKPQRQIIEGTEGLTKVLTIQLLPVETVVPPQLKQGTTQSRPTRQPDKPTLVPAFVLGGVTTVGLVSGVVLLTMASTDYATADRISKEIRSNGGSCAEGAANFHTRCDEVQQFSQASDTKRNVGVGFLVGSSLTAVGTASYILVASGLFDKQTPEQQKTAVHLHAAPTFGAGSAGLMFAGRF